MIRLSALYTLLTGQPYLTPAQQAYEDARRDAIKAELAHDDRALGAARMKMAAAQLERLRTGE